MRGGALRQAIASGWEGVGVAKVVVVVEEMREDEAKSTVMWLMADLNSAPPLR